MPQIGIYEKKNTMEYAPGDPILIKNIVTQLKSQGIFDQIRKECIADVDTKPAYQNLCHRADTQVSKFLSKVKWGPDLHKNQTRENIRKQVNECSFVEPGIAIIVDQLVNPRINTVLVPKVEDMLYKYLGIPREVDTTTSQKETKSYHDKSSLRDVPDYGAPGISRVEMNDRKRDNENRYNDGSQDHYRMENKKHDGVSGRIDSFTNKMKSSGDRYGRDRSSYVKTESFDSNYKDSDKSIKMEPERHYSRMDTKITAVPEFDFDSESSDDEMSPPFEPNVKSDNDMSIGSGDSNFSEIIDTKISSEPDIPGVDPEPDIVCKADDSKIITQHEESLDSIRSADSSPPAPEKVHISPLEIPKTPTINYETSDDSDDYVKNKKLETVAVNASEPLEVPEVNFDKIVEKVIEDNTESKAPETAEIKSAKEEDKCKDKNRSDDTKKKDEPKSKDDKPIKPVESKEKHVEKKSEHRSDKDRKHDKHRSEYKSKDREKDKPKHDSSKSHSRKDDKSHHSKDHSKSDHDRKSKTDHRKDDYKKDDKSDHRKDSGRSEHKKDDKREHKKDDKTEHRKDPRTDRKKEDDRKHSKDDKDRKKDPHKVPSLSDDKKSSSKAVKTEDSKQKLEKHDKPRDDKKSSKPSDHNKAKKKEDDPKKSRSHCNVDEKKKTDRRSSDRDSSGPSTSNSSSIHHASAQHSSKSEKDKGSKHRHSSSSSSSHKTKRNDTEHEKSRTEKPPNDREKNPAAEDDLEMILESSPDKGFQNNIKSGADFSAREIFPDKPNEQSNDNIENMMNEMFQPTKPILKKPKIAKNFADIRRIMKLRKLYEEDVKFKSCEQNADDFAPDGDKSTLYKIKLRKTVDYFVMRRFGKNGNLEKCKDLTNAIIDTLTTDVKLNITRVDRQYSLVDGSCMLSDDENGPIHNNIDNGKTNGTKSFNDEVDDIPIIKDERANLILEDLANSYTDPNFKLGNVPDECKVEQPIVAVPLLEEDTIKIVQSEIKANGAKTKLPKQLSIAEDTDEVAENEISPTVKLKIKSVSDGKMKTWQAYDQLKQIEDPTRYFPMPNYNSDFMQFANKLLNDEYDFEMANLFVEMDYPECYDFMFTEFLGAKVDRRKCDDPKTSPIKYNSEIITNKKSGDKSIMLRIKKSSESEESADRKILNKKRKLADDSGVELDANESGKEEPVKKKKKTLGIKRTFANPLKMKLTSGQLSDTIGNNLNENNTDAKAKATPVVKKVTKVNKNKEIVVSSNQLNDTVGNDLTENIVVSETKTTPVPKKTAKVNKNKAMALNSGHLNDTVSNDQTENTVPFKTKNTPVVKKAKVNKSKEMAIANANHKKSESESSDGRRSSVSSTGTSTHSKGTNELHVSVSSAAPATTQTKTKTKNTALNDSKTDTIETNVNEGAATTKTPDPPVKKANDTKNAEERRKQSIMNCYYDESDLYKPRPSLRLTSRRYRLGNTDNT